MKNLKVCNCLKEMELKIAKENFEFTGIGYAFNMKGKAMISAEIIEIGKGRGYKREKRHILFNFCPFCGKKLIGGDK